MPALIAPLQLADHVLHRYADRFGGGVGWRRWLRVRLRLYGCRGLEDGLLRLKGRGRRRWKSHGRPGTVEQARSERAQDEPGSEGGEQRPGRDHQRKGCLMPAGEVGYSFTPLSRRFKPSSPSPGLAV
jgi:hypothetical protein